GHCPAPVRPRLLRRRSAPGPGRRAGGDAVVLSAGSVRDVRGAAAQRPPRGHDGDRRQGRADDRRDQGVARGPARRREVARLSRLLRPLLLGGARRVRAGPVRHGGFPAGGRGADRSRP
ncbi:MAG: FIG00636596: hypothetical protein, partial [uncultured Sphingomonadaceae bacterium]